jgi:hypothetical protein
LKGGVTAVGARAINAILAIWLFVSAFLWRHTYVQSENAWVVGFIALLMALGGMSGLAWARYMNVILGAWLILSPLFVRLSSRWTFFNLELVGLGLVVFGLMPRLHRRPPGSPAHSPPSSPISTNDQNSLRSD